MDAAEPDPEETAATATARRVAAWMQARDRVRPGLGIVVEDVGVRFVRLAMTVRGDMLNAHGLCHGGVVFTLADCAFAIACNSENASTLAKACSIEFLAAAYEGDRLTAVAEARAQQDRFGVYDVTVSAADGRPIALFRGQSCRIRGETMATPAPRPEVG